MIEKYCVICGKKYTPNKKDHKSKYCSEKCSKNKYKKTCPFCKIDFFGSRDKIYCSDECKNKDKKTIEEKKKKSWLEKYGTDHPFKNKDIQNKIKKTNLEKYGVENPLSSKEIQEKIKKTNLKKYGVDNPNKSKEIREKSKRTNLKRYGVEYSFQSEKIKDKIKQTNLEKYGVIHPSKIKEIQEKIKKTNLEKYGVNYYTQTEEYLEKTKYTCLEKYGVDNPNKNKEIKQKTEQTNLEKYGVKNPFQSEEIKKKIKNTLLKKYGVEYISQSESIKNKIKASNLKKYGKEYYTQTKEYLNKVKKTNLEKYGVDHNPQKHITNYENYNEDFIKENFIENGKFNIHEFGKYFNINISNINKLKKKFNILEPSRIKNIKTQLEIINFIKNFYKKTIITNDKNILFPKELDIYIPEKNIALEYNGLSFHSFGKHKSSFLNNYDKEDKNYHLLKTEMCEKQEVKLFHIFENEWIDPIKQEIWKSVIKNSLGLIDQKIYARKCTIKEIKDNSYLNFLDQNHLQGSINSKINIGLFHNNELVSLMTFGKSRFNKNYDYELLRFCNKINNNVVGSFSKLLKYFKSNYSGKIISYGNRRWVNIHNNVYERNNGKLIKTSDPNYYYFKTNTKTLESRLKYQKHKLKDKLEFFDENLTETENMYNNGYRKIYDCGNLVYEL